MGETKARAVDPPFLENGEKIPASSHSEELAENIQRHLDQVNAGFRIRVEGYQ